MTALPSFHKTRFAPTPSGYLHIGNVLSFVITAALARKTDAKILLRIDDLDRERMEKTYVQDIFDTLTFMDLPWDEGPKDYTDYEREWSQVHRMSLYNDALRQLADEGKVFACNCSRSKIQKDSKDGGYPGTCIDKGLPLDAPDTCWRLRTDSHTPIVIRTMTGTETTTLPPDQRHFVARKRDGYPAYQLASVVDDLHYGIGLVTRGMDLWPSTIAQHYLATQLNRAAFADIVFHHHPLVMADGDHKLSKSAGATSIQRLRNEGKTSADIYAMIARALGLAASPHTANELIELL